MVKIFTQQCDVPIIDDYDVIVIGGGVAGMGAALSAKRNGCQVLLIEKGVCLGGLATLGLIVYYEPLCDGKGPKIMTGIAEELLKASIKYGFNTLPEEWKSNSTLKMETNKRYQTHFSAPAFTLALDEIIDVWGIDILYDTVFSTTVMDGKGCEGIILESKSGKIAYTAKTFIDTTGDLDVMSRSGAPYVVNDNTKETYQKWLKNKYGSLEVLGQVWYRYSYTDWEQINPRLCLDCFQSVLIG